MGRASSNNWGGMGVTLIDSLDTLWLMGYENEFYKGRYAHDCSVGVALSLPNRAHGHYGREKKKDVRVHFEHSRFSPILSLHDMSLRRRAALIHLPCDTSTCILESCFNEALRQTMDTGACNKLELRYNDRRLFSTHFVNRT